MVGFFNKLTENFGEISLGKQLFILITSLSMGIAVAVYVDDKSDSQLAVNGPQYQKIVLQKDLVADVLPPPSYLIEAWKVCLEMVAIKDAPLQDLFVQSELLKKDFIDRHDFWLTNLDKSSAIDKKMNQDVYESGIKFLQIRDEKFFPAIRADDADAITAALSELEIAYGAHRRAVDEVVKLSDSITTKLEAETAYKLGNGQMTSYIIAGTLIAFSILMSFLVLAAIRKKLGGEASEVLIAAQRLAKGDLSCELNVLNNDKNSVMHSIKVLQGNLKSLIDSLTFVCDAQAKGEFDTNLHAHLFTGSYATLAEKVNEMLAMQLKEMHAVMHCVQGFGSGDFNAKIAAFPGKKSEYNDKIEQVRLNLKALSFDARKLTEAAEHGNLEVRADITKHQGDFRKIIEGVNNTLDLIMQPIKMVDETANTIRTIANEISASNNDLAKRTEQQAASLEETAATMEQLAATVKQNADHADHANDLAATATQVAIKGGSDVDLVISTMTEISKSANKISDIISVIDGIAFQTNILALNAAVEAARAGEQGRGFAVVAGEVRNLAQRSSNAAKEIKDLINDSLQKTNEGSLHVEHAGKTMKEVVHSIKSVSSLVAEIADASKEQSVGLEQISIAISTLDDTTQQNVVMVEQAAVSASTLSDQAKSLYDNISVFKTSQSSPQPAAGVKPTPVNSASRSTEPLQSHERGEDKQAYASPRVVARTGTHDVGWEEF